MNRYDRRIADEYVAVTGDIIACYADFIRVSTQDGNEVGFKIGKQAPLFPVGTPVTVISASGSSHPTHVINHLTGIATATADPDGTLLPSVKRLHAILSVIEFLALLIPIFGQFVALIRGLGAIVSGLIFKGIKGARRAVSIRRMLLAMIVYFSGSIWIVVGENKIPGFGALVIGALMFSFWANRPMLHHLKALDAFVQSHIQSGTPT